MISFLYKKNVLRLTSISIFVCLNVIVLHGPMKQNSNSAPGLTLLCSPFPRHSGITYLLPSLSDNKRESKVREELRQRAVELSMHRYENYEASSVKDAPSSDCDCLPGCMSLVYNAETSQADFMWPDLFDAFKANKSEFPNVALTRITIFFKEQQFITSERNELYGRVDFLANCGGILGLFTGFSFLSIVEVLYFLSLKLICNVRKFGVHNWSG